MLRRLREILLTMRARVLSFWDMRRIYVRTAVLVSYAAVLRRLGHDPAPPALAVGLDPALFASPDATTSGVLVYRLLERAAEQFAIPDLGLRVARERSGLAYFGALGALVRDESQVRGALRRLELDGHLHTTTTSFALTETDGRAAVEVRMHAGGETALRQSTECAVALLCNTLRHWLGPSWHPLSVHLAHPRPPDSSSHAAFFDCPVRFGGNVNVLALAGGDLDRPIPFSDHALRAYATVPRVSLAPGRQGLIRPELVSDTMVRLLADGRCSADAVASALGVDRRTLHRHLERQGASFSSMLVQTRLELAEHHLRDRSFSITETADALGFRSVSAFSRWCVAQTGRPPSAWPTRRRAMAAR